MSARGTQPAPQTPRRIAVGYLLAACAGLLLWQAAFHCLSFRDLPYRMPGTRCSVSWTNR